MRIPGGRALGAIRRTNSHNLPYEADLLRLERVRIPGSGGQYEESWVIEVADVPCAMDPANQGGDNIVADQPAVAAQWRLRFEWDQGVREGMRALVKGEDFTRLVVVRRNLTPRSPQAMTVILADDVVFP